MKPTQILSKEHENILKITHTINEECRILDSGSQLNKDSTRKMIEFIKNYADKFHHAKEEEILFKEFEKCANEEKMHCNPIEQMLFEHNEGRNFVKNMEESLEENDKDKFITNAKWYAYLIQEHIFKEDNVLFPLIDEILTKKTQEQILKKFEQAEKKKFNKGAKEKYLSIIKQKK